MDPVVRVEVKKDTGDASLLVGIIAGAIVGAALAWVWTDRPPRQLVIQPPLPFGEASTGAEGSALVEGRADGGQR